MSSTWTIVECRVTIARAAVRVQKHSQLCVHLEFRMGVHPSGRSYVQTYVNEISPPLKHLTMKSNRPWDRRCDTDAMLTLEIFVDIPGQPDIVPDLPGSGTALGFRHQFFN